MAVIVKIFGESLRIFAKYLYDYGHTSGKIFTIETMGGLVTAEVTRETNGKANQVKIDMGKAIFSSRQVPVMCDESEWLDHPLNIVDETYLINCVSVGNPHCVIVCNKLTKAEIIKHGSEIENHPMFPNRINVQFAKVISRNEVEILILSLIHISEPTRLGMISYAVFCLKNKKKQGKKR